MPLLAISIVQTACAVRIRFNCGLFGVVDAPNSRPHNTKFPLLAYIRNYKIAAVLRICLYFAPVMLFNLANKYLFRLIEVLAHSLTPVVIQFSEISKL